MDSFNIVKSKSDVLGVLASGLCAVNCAATPLVFMALPTMEASCSATGCCTGYWGALDYLFLALSAVAVWFSTRKSGFRSLKRLLWAFWAVFGVGLLAGSTIGTDGKWLMYLGSAGLVFTHLYNIQYCKSCESGLC